MKRVIAHGFVLLAACLLPSLAGAFELRPGVVVDAADAAAYLMNPDGGIDKISLRSGDLLWTTTEAAKPLAIHGDVLIAQAERRDAANRLEIVMLDTAGRGERRRQFEIELPSGVVGSIDEGMGRELTVRADLRNGEAVASWEYTTRYTGGIKPPADQALQNTQRRAYRLDESSGRAIEIAITDDSLDQPLLPTHVRRWADSGARTAVVHRAGALLAATEVDRDSDRITLKRWDAASGRPLADVDLFEGSHILQFPSADGRHLLVAERAFPGEFAEYRWSIYSLETGERLGQLSHQQSHAWFFVAGDSLVYIERPYGRRVGVEWIDAPRRLRAVSLRSGATAWERPLRDTTFRGQYPR